MLSLINNCVLLCGLSLGLIELSNRYWGFAQNWRRILARSNHVKVQKVSHCTLPKIAAAYLAVDWSFSTETWTEIRQRRNVYFSNLVAIPPWKLVTGQIEQTERLYITGVDWISGPSNQKHVWKGRFDCFRALMLCGRFGWSPLGIGQRWYIWKLRHSSRGYIISIV